MVCAATYVQLEIILLSEVSQKEKKKCLGFPDGAVVSICLPVQETQVRSLVQDDPLCMEQLSLSAATTEPTSRSH